MPYLTKNFFMRELIAILRGVQSDEATGIAEALIDAGIQKIEVPLNSPNPLQSIERLVQAFGQQAMIGAGTVLSTDAVNSIARIGGRMVLSPNCDIAVVKAARAHC